MHATSHRRQSAGCCCCHCLSHRLRRLERRRDRVRESQENPAVIDSFLKEVTRTLLLTGDGTRLDSSIREAIGWYAEVDDEIRRIEQTEKLSPDLRADVSVGFHRMLSRLAEFLVRLGVQMTAIQPGTKLGESQFRVVDQLETDDVAKLKTVAECVQPEFSWVNGYGTKRVEPAHVRAYTTCSTSKADKNRRFFR